MFVVGDAEAALLGLHFDVGTPAETLVAAVRDSVVFKLQRAGALEDPLTQLESFNAAVGTWQVSLTA